MTVVLTNLAEEIQQYISDNSSLNLNYDPVADDVNFTLGNILNVTDLDFLLGSNIDLTMFEEGGSVSPTGRREKQERSFRFVYKGNSGQLAINLCWALVEWLWNSARTFQTATFRIWIPRFPDKLPSVIAANQDGSHLADFVVTFFAFTLVG